MVEAVALPTSPARDAGSYRDPAGFVFRRDGVLYRQVDASFADDWQAYLDSGLYARLRGEGLVIAHDEADLQLAAEPGAAAVIRPRQLPLISYPYEWSFSQLQDAALLTLRAQSVAAEAGFTLRDASAYNVQFHEGKPILIDSLSFERAEPSKPWAPYRQFCEHFLAPLALMSRVDIRLGRLLRDHLDGIPLDLAARLLPGRTRLSFGLGPHIHLHARAQRQHADDNAAADAKAEASMSADKLATLVESLQNTVSGLSWEPEGTAWADYADNTSYTDEATRAKMQAVEAAVTKVAGATAWDLGANTGRYSRIAADAGYRVVALDIDPAAVERGYRALKADGRTDITPLLADITDPSPGLGWANAERASLLDRIDADVILALALVHHLAIGANVPLPMIASVFAGMAPHAVVEFVPKDDPMVRRLLSFRRDVFPEYHLEGFGAAFEPYYEVEAETPIEGSGRILFHFRRR